MVRKIIFYENYFIEFYQSQNESIRPTIPVSGIDYFI